MGPLGPLGAPLGPQGAPWGPMGPATSPFRCCRAQEMKSIFGTWSLDFGVQNGETKNWIQGLGTPQRDLGRNSVQDPGPGVPNGGMVTHLAAKRCDLGCLGGPGPSSTPWTGGRATGGHTNSDPTGLHPPPRNLGGSAPQTPREAPRAQGPPGRPRPGRRRRGGWPGGPGPMGPWALGP